MNKSIKNEQIYQEDEWETIVVFMLSLTVLQGGEDS